MNSRALAGLLLLSLLTLAADARAQSQPEFANKVKAGFVYNFAKFIDWPAAAFATGSDRLVLGVLGDDSLAVTLAEVDGRTAQGRRVRVRAIETDEALESCHLLYVAADQLPRLPVLAKRLARRSILLVGEAEEFIERGGMIRLYIEDGMVRFAMCPARVRAAGLLPSAKLMKVAKTVACRLD